MNAQKSRIAQAFSNSADSYEQASQLQAEVAKEVATLALADLPSNPRVLEIGCGTGGLTKHLLTQVEGGSFLITDIAPNMVEKCREACVDKRARYLRMDGEHPALEGQEFDLIVSSLAMQWFADLAAGIERLTAHLVPGGRLVFSTLAHETFANWRTAHTELGLKDGTPIYPTPQQVDGMWPEGGQGQVSVDLIKREYEDAQTFARRLKTIGANTPAQGHRPLSPKNFRKISAHLGRNFVDHYHIVYGAFTKG
ncbi:MAG: methyltransferase domain-containing protein [Magnetovibrio sp.]|nr:methyltransferase domain-containing protein [Magnetovibrio sp.]